MYSILSAMSSRSFHMPARGESPTERGLPEGVSTGTYTSTTVPSLIGTSCSGLKTPFSYFAAMVMRLAPVYTVAGPPPARTQKSDAEVGSVLKLS